MCGSPGRNSPEKLTQAKKWPVVLYLKGIATNLKPNDPLLIDTGDALPELYRTLKVAPDAARDRTRVEVKPWRRTQELDATVSRPAGMAAAANAPELGKITSVTGVLESLAKKPKPQPRGRLYLNRNATTLFGSGSDLSARLATLAQPELRDVFYQAWANVPVTRAPTLKVCALRTRASVFGHNAPLELVPPQREPNNDQSSALHPGSGRS